MIQTLVDKISAYGISRTIRMSGVALVCVGLFLVSLPGGRGSSLLLPDAILLLSGFVLFFRGHMAIKSGLSDAQLIARWTGGDPIEIADQIERGYRLSRRERLLIGTAVVVLSAFVLAVGAAFALAAGAHI